MKTSRKIRLACEHHPDVVLLGLNTIISEKPSSMGLFACDTIRGLVQTCQTNILVLCRHAHRVLVRAVIRAGASGFMLKDDAMNSCAALAQVADLLSIAESTLRNNLSAISRALDTPNANGAMIECLRLGLVQINH